MQIIIDDLVVHYKVEGRGKTILLLHGWGDSLNTFDHLSKNLGQKYRIVRLDLPGFGGSETPKSTYDLARYSDLVERFLSKIDCSNPYAIIGHSNGGAIALKGLSQQILVTKKLVLLASSGIRASYNGRRKVLRLMAKTVKYPTKLLPTRLQNRLKRSVYKHIGSELFVAEDLQETFKKIVSEDLVAAASHVKSQTLLLYGTEDDATPVQYGENFNRAINNSRLHTVIGADHFLHHSHAEEVERIISSFLDEK